MQTETWRIELLGPLRIRRGAEEVVRFRTRQAAALLARLALFPHRDHPREELIDLLWPDADPEAARPRLRQELASLRRLLEPEEAANEGRGRVIHADRFCLRLRGDAVITDAAEFEAGLEAARTADWPERSVLLRRALALVRGELLPGHAEPWVQEERSRLRDAALLAWGELAAHYEGLGDLTEASLAIQRAVETAPRREDLRAEVNRLQRRRRAALSAEGRPAAEGAPPDLPQPLTRFFGREAEIDALLRLLPPNLDGCPAPARLVTLAGPGGSGKTRLALEVAARLVSAGLENVRFLPLADITDASLLPDAMLAELRIPRTPGKEPLELLVERLRDHGGVLVLDNMEQMMQPAPAGGAPSHAALLIQTLLERVSGLRCLVTSRQPLAIRGEVEFPVAPLPGPSGEETLEQIASFACVRLFVDRARAVRRDFRLTPGNTPVVAALCSRLEGIPLALELAAAWISILSPTQIQERLAQRFDLLVSRQRDVPERHRTLRAAIEGSFQLLPPDLQAFFVTLSLFRGGWTLSSAAAICPESPALEGLAQLRERSLLVAEEGAWQEDEMRYRMLETLRDYVSEQWPSGECNAAARRHALYFLHLAEAARSEISRSETPYLRKLETEHDNLRAALDWCLEPEAGAERIEIGLRLAIAMRLFWTVRGYLAEGRGRFVRLFERSDGVTASVLAEAFSSAGVLARYQGDYEAAESYYERALRLFREQSDERGIASTLNNLGVAARVRGDYAAARSLHEQGLAIRRRLDQAEDLSASLNNLGIVARVQGDFDEARVLHNESLELAIRSGHGRGISTAMVNLGAVAVAAGEFEEAYRLLIDCLRLYREEGNQTGIVEALEGIASAFAGQSRPERAAALWGFAHDLRISLGVPISPADIGEYRAGLEQARILLDTTAFAVEWERGRRLSLPEAIAEAEAG